MLIYIYILTLKLVFINVIVYAASKRVQAGSNNTSSPRCAVECEYNGERKKNLGNGTETNNDAYIS